MLLILSQRFDACLHGQDSIDLLFDIAIENIVFGVLLFGTFMLLTSGALSIADF